MAQRIREMREIEELSVEELAQKTEVSVEEYKAYESGQGIFPFTFIHKCALAFGIELFRTCSAVQAHCVLHGYKKGQGTKRQKEEGIEIKNLALFFRNKLGEPYWVKIRIQRIPSKQSGYIPQKHAGQEFDLVLSGKLKSPRRRQHGSS